MNHRTVKVISLDLQAQTAKLRNPDPNYPAATFNITLGQPSTSGVCVTTAYGVGGNIQLNDATSNDLISYGLNGVFDFYWGPGEVIVRTVDIVGNTIATGGN